MKRIIIYLVAVLALVTGTTLAGSLTNSQSDITMAGDHYLAGDTVQVTDDTAGDLIIAASSVHISGDVAGDVLVFARTITIDGDVAGSIRGAAQTVNINGSIGHKLMMAAMQLQLNAGNQANANSVAVAGGEVTISRPLAGYALVAAQTVSINESIDGPVRLITDGVLLADQVKLPSGVTFQKVNNNVQTEEAISRLRNIAQVTVIEAPVRAASVIGYTNTVLDNLLVAIELVLLGLVAWWLIPDGLTTIVETQRSNGWLITFFGIVGVPLYIVLAVSMIITVVLAPVGVVMLLMAPVLLILSYVAFVINVGRLVTIKRTGKPLSMVGWLGVGALVLYILNLIPLVGLLVGLVAFIISAGVWWLLFLRKVRALK